MCETPVYVLLKIMVKQAIVGNFLLQRQDFSPVSLAPDSSFDAERWIVFPTSKNFHGVIDENLCEAVCMTMHL